jgi:hypothetical protein
VPGVGDRDDDVVIGQPRRQPDPAAVVGVLERVVQDVREDLLEPDGVAVDPARLRREQYVELLFALRG